MLFVEFGFFYLTGYKGCEKLYDYRGNYQQ